MKIESLIRPTQLQKGQSKLCRTVHLFGKPYIFTQTIDDKYVADIDDPKAIECVLKLPKQYRQYVEPKPAVSRTVKVDPADAASVAAAAAEAAAQEKAEADEAAAAAEAAKAVAQQEANEAADAQKVAIEAEVQALLSSTPQAIKKIVEKKTPTREVLEQAIAVETKAEKPRPQVLNLLTGTLSSLDDAG